MAGVLAQDAPEQAVCDALVDAANRAGGPDNITVILVRL
jgi:serine/threonine protein phosphatase PrpC